MSCTDNTCGTGGGNLPKPGDPSNDITITATPAYGGIDVRWTLPLTNPFAVAYAMIYRSTNSTFGSSIPVARDTDGFYYDKVGPNTVYYYWVQLVSINGTHSEIFGPASSTAMSSIQQTLVDLTGKIDAGVLAQALKSEIARIPMIDLKILKEIEDRIDAHLQLSGALQLLDANVQGAMTLLNQEVTQRTDGQSALVASLLEMAAQVDGNGAAIQEEKVVRATATEALATQINSMASKVDANTASILSESQTRATADSAQATQIQQLFTKTDENKAAIDTERTTRTTANSAMAQEISTLFTKAGENTAAIQAEQTARSNADGALAQQITTLGTRTGAAEAAIQTETTARTNADSALSQQITTLTTKVDDASAAVQTEATTRANADSALAQQITTVQSELNGNISQVQQTLQTNINTAKNAADAAALTAGSAQTAANNAGTAASNAQGTANSAQNKANALGALYTVKTNVNGLIGGFGMYNDGQTVQMGFDVDSFWVGRTNSDKIKPFIINGGVTYINDAVIEKVTFNKLRSENGAFIVDANGKVKADYIDVENLVAKKIDVKGQDGRGLNMINTGIKVIRSNNSIAVKIGSLL